MKLVTHIEPSCYCLNKIARFVDTNLVNRWRTPNGSWGIEHLYDVGTVIECDCGRQYTYTGMSTSDGAQWISSGVAK